MDRIFQKKSTRRTIRAGVSVSALVVAASTARAATELAGATLEAENSAGAETCPDAEALRTRTLALGLPPAKTGAPLRIQVTFRREGPAFAATVRTSGRSSGERELRDASPSCDALAAATSVTLAVLLDLRPRDVAPPPRASTTPAASTTQRPHVFRYVALHAHQSVAYGVLGPAFSVAFGGDARVRLSRFELMLGGFASLARSVDLPPGNVDVRLAAGYSGLCVAALRGSRLELGACATFLVGQFHAAGHGYYVDDEHAGLWMAGSLGATLVFELSRHGALRLGASAVVPFQQEEPLVDRVGVAYDAPPVGGVASFGPEFRFP